MEGQKSTPNESGIRRENPSEKPDLSSQGPTPTTPGLSVTPDDWDEAMKPLPCEPCGTTDTRSAWDHQCLNHGTWVKCPDCEATFPLGAGTYDPGSPAVYYLRNGDPGYPGDPPEIYCPACEDGPSSEPEVVVE